MCNGRYPRTLRDRILEAPPESLVDENADNLDPHKIWAAMMTNEKTGGHGAHLSSCQAWGGHEPPNSSKGSWSRAERRPQRSRRLPNLRGGSDGLRKRLLPSSRAEFDTDHRPEVRAAHRHRLRHDHEKVGRAPIPSRPPAVRSRARHEQVPPAARRRGDRAAHGAVGRLAARS